MSPFLPEADDQTRVLWNYNFKAPGYSYAATEMRQIKYGLGTTQYISVN